MPQTGQESVHFSPHVPGAHPWQAKLARDQRDTRQGFRNGCHAVGERANSRFVAALGGTFKLIADFGAKQAQARLTGELGHGGDYRDDGH